MIYITHFLTFVFEFKFEFIFELSDILFPKVLKGMVIAVKEFGVLLSLSGVSKKL